MYLPNASDPVVWWSPRLITSPPDWLRGTRGPDVSPSTVWIPFVTFCWADVAQPPGWTAADTERLRGLIG